MQQVQEKADILHRQSALSQLFPSPPSVLEQYRK